MAESMSAFEAILAAADAGTGKTTPRLLERVDAMLATYERRQSTAVPGTVSLIRDLAAAVRAGGELEAIVRDLAANEPLAEMNSDYPQYRYCLYCEANNAPGPGRPETSDPPGVVHADGCNWRKAVEWVERHD